MNPLLIRRRGMMKAQGGGGGGDGQLQWIETDGVAYIDSGVNMRTPVAARILCRLNATISALEVLMGYGNTTNVNTQQTFARHYSTGDLGFGYHIVFTDRMDISSMEGYDMEILCQMRSGNQLLSARKVGDANYVTLQRSNTQAISTAYNYFIFATYESGSPQRICSAGTRIYSIELYSDYNMTNKIAEFLPWRDNGEVGMMEIVGNNFIGNAAGSGAFVGGPNVN